MIFDDHALTELLICGKSVRRAPGKTRTSAPEEMTKDNFMGELDPISSYYVATAQPRLKNLIGAAMLFKGEIDEDTMRLAFRKTLSRFPQFISRLKEKRRHWLYRLVLEPDPDHSLDLDITTLNHSSAGAPLAQVIGECLEPILEKDWDPFNRVPSEFQLVRIQKELHLLIAVFNHAIADPWTLSGFGRELARRYAAATRRSKPVWHSQSHATSALKNARLNHFRDRREQRWTNSAVSGTHTASGRLRLALGVVGAFLMARPGVATGNYGKHKSIDSQARRWFTPEETASLTKVSSMLGVSLTDRLVCASNLAIDEWNAMRDRKAHAINTCVTVLMRGRERRSPDSSDVSVVVLKSEPAERSDRENFLVSVSRRRARKLRDKEDGILRAIAAGIHNGLRVFPPRIAAVFMRVLARKRLFSICISNVGIIWPEIRASKFTGDSYLSEMGGLDIVEVHCFCQGMAVFSDMFLVTHIFRNRLNLVLNTSPEAYSKQETETLADLIVNNLKMMARTDSP